MKIEEVLKMCISVLCGAAASFFGQYGLLFVFVAVAVILDFVTGIIKAEAVGEGLDSKRARQGFWRKIALFAALSFGIFLDLISDVLLETAGIVISYDTPFALIVASYIVLNESISIAENLYQINPKTLPNTLVKLLKVARDKSDRE